MRLSLSLRQPSPRLSLSRPPRVRPPPRTPIATTMVEGHGTHRVAASHRQALVGKAFVATSPNGRFVEGAAAVNGRVLSDVQAHGKHVFYIFGAGADSVVVHVHFGMSGRFSTHALPGPEPTATTRLRLVNEPSSTVALLSAMTVEHGDLAFMALKRSALGPDPLREDADGEKLWAKMRTSKKPVGLILMDQSFVAGLGNIYRAEVLFVSGVHPETPGCLVTRDRFEALWSTSVRLLQAGFATGSIITVDPAEKLPAPWTRRYIYNQDTCGRCRGPIKTWDMATRTVYACETCQPLIGTMSAARAEAHAKASAPRLFQSHCAPDGAGEALHPAKMSVQQLKAALQGRSLSASGAKPVLLARLLEAFAAEMPKTEDKPAQAAPPAPKAAAPMPRPGTAHLGGFASAAAAAAEKLRAGENAAVEHVALHDDAAIAVRSKTAVAPKRQRKTDEAAAGIDFPQRKRR